MGHLVRSADFRASREDELPLPHTQSLRQCANAPRACAHQLTGVEQVTAIALYERLRGHNNTVRQNAVPFLQSKISCCPCMSYQNGPGIMIPIGAA